MFAKEAIEMFSCLKFPNFRAVPSVPEAGRAFDEYCIKSRFTRIFTSTMFFGGIPFGGMPGMGGGPPQRQVQRGVVLVCIANTSGPA
jgi:hypothetical protein